jgi:hypothetical protein
MKFGHTLRTSLNPDWTANYVGKKRITYLFLLIDTRPNQANFT